MKHDWQAGVTFIFFMLAALVAAFSVIQIVRFPFEVQVTSKSVDLSGLRRLPTSQLAPLESYQNDFSSHALFMKPKVQAPVKGPNLAELLKPYTLTGIIQGGDAEALIQNNMTKQTYYVQAGEGFDQFKVVDVRDHSVVVEFQGERKELFIEGTI
jgi:hypothetical protein